MTGNGYRGNERLREFVVRPAIGKNCAEVKRLGFEFSRRKRRGGRDALEFYLNFYQTPDPKVLVESMDRP